MTKDRETELIERNNEVVREVWRLNEENAKLREMLSYGGSAVIRACVECQTPYPDFSVSSHMSCWKCRCAMTLAGRDKAIALLNAGMESQAEICDSLKQENRKLLAELARLRRGDFTESEFQSLCHHRDESPGCTRAEFERGCREYQEKLFADAKPLQPDPYPLNEE